MHLWILYLCMVNLNLIELFHRPHMFLQGPPDYFSTSVKQIYFCMVVACAGAAVHKKSLFYCIILRAWFLRRFLEMTHRSALCIGYLLSGLSATVSQGHWSAFVSMRLVDSGLSMVLCFNRGKFMQ